MVADRCQRSHVERGADPGAATPDAPAPAPGAAVAVEGGHPDEGGDLLGGSSARVRALRRARWRRSPGRCRECAGARWRGGAGWARPARRPRSARSACWIRRVNTARSASLPASSSGARWRRCCCSVTRAVTSWCRRRPRVWSRRSAFESGGRRGGRTSAAKRASTRASSAIGLGQGAVGAGEVADLARIDHDHRQARQGGHHGPLVAAAGFQHDAGGPQGLPADPASGAGRRASAAPSRSRPWAARPRPTGPSPHRSPPFTSV